MQMRSIDASLFWKAVICGILATFVMTMTGFWQAGIGLPKMDVGAMLTEDMTSAHPDNPYSLFYGNLAHFMNGITLALIWVAFLEDLFDLNWFVQGIIYAVLTELAAVIIVVPLAAGVGIFFANTPAPGWMLLGSFIIHLAYAWTLTLSLSVGEAAAETSV